MTGPAPGTQGRETPSAPCSQGARVGPYVGTGPPAVWTSSSRTFATLGPASSQTCNPFDSRVGLPFGRAAFWSGCPEHLDGATGTMWWPLGRCGQAEESSGTLQTQVFRGCAHLKRHSILRTPPRPSSPPNSTSVLIILPIQNVSARLSAFV